MSAPTNRTNPARAGGFGFSSDGLSILGYTPSGVRAGATVGSHQTKPPDQGTHKRTGIGVVDHALSRTTLAQTATSFGPYRDPLLTFAPRRGGY